MGCANRLQLPAAAQRVPRQISGTARYLHVQHGAALSHAQIRESKLKSGLPTLAASLFLRLGWDSHKPPCPIVFAYPAKRVGRHKRRAEKLGAPGPLSGLGKPQSYQV